MPGAFRDRWHRCTRERQSATGDDLPIQVGLRAFLDRC
jgi:hypothetical protein